LFISAFRLCATKPTTASAKCFIPIAARSSHELGLAHDEKGVSCPIYIARKPDSAQQSMSHVLSNPFPSDPGGNAEDLRDTPDGGGWSSSSSGSTNLAN
jgi:hypothetical protein